MMARGMGGGARMDVRENLIALCRLCHDGVHTGRISRWEILQRIAARERLSTDEVMDRLYALLRARKSQ